MALPERLSRLVSLLSRLPGVGEKTAQRFVLHMLAQDTELPRRLAEELVSIGEHLRPCERCGHIAEVTDPAEPIRCSICRDQKRDPRILCVVARIQDLLAIERSGAMRGRYFILGRLISPLEGVGPEDLPLETLRRRIAEEPIAEIVVATPPSVDGEATALFLARELGSQVRVSRIASGVPHGGDLEFADQITLGRAIEGRKEL
ncbi:MAG TPA: recombination mediator RecR [Polyangiaceae bacterium]|nr:recombination mediator RecR [Polyangiaceae bacterium]